jgi:hypothetical protein
MQVRFRLKILTSCFFLLQSFSASAQLLDVGSQSLLASGGTRGFWFTAPTNFTITGVGAPADTVSSNFDISILRFVASPPLLPSNTTTFDTLYLSRDNAGSSLINVRIAVTAGQIIGVMGGRRDSDNLRTANSYGVNPYVSSVLGLPVTLTRLRMEGNISTSDPSSVGVSTENGSFIGRLLLFIAPPGPDVTNTTSAIQENISALRGVMDRRLSGLALMSSYDCNTFDNHGVCVSFQARYSNFDSFNEGAGVFTAAYRASENIRIGTFFDYRASEKDSTGVQQGDALPTIGAFAAYSHSGNATGFQAKASAAYDSGKVTITRAGSVADNTEAGSGKAGLNSYAIGAELAWGFALSPMILATPYAGVRYSDATRKSYTEGTVSGTVDFPITYDAYYQRLTTATVGVRLSGMFSDKVGYQMSLGGEFDLAHKAKTYSGASTIPGLLSFDLTNTGSSNRSRVVASTGLYYQMDKTQRLTATVGVRGQAYSSQPSVSTLVGYQVAF